MIYKCLRALAVTTVLAGGPLLASVPHAARAQPVVVVEEPHHHWHHWHHRHREWDHGHRHWHYRYW